jgi:5'-nucleotidase
MNPGGIRADIESADGKYPADVSYKQVADVQPFGDKIDIMDLKGSQIKTLLEEQWQPSGASRPILHLGLSEGFTYTYDPADAKNHHIIQMWLNGKPIDLNKTYTIVTNDFLAAGGDQFFEFANGKNLQETGRVDLQTFVNFMHLVAKGAPLQVDNSQRSVGIVFPKGAPKSYGPGDTVKFDLSSLTFPMPKNADRQEQRDGKVEIKMGDKVLGTFKVADFTTSDKDDETGKATVSVVLPDTIGKDAALTVVGTTTGTEVRLPVTLKAGSTETTSTAVVSTSSSSSAAAPGTSTAPTSTSTAPELSETGVNVAVPAALAALLLLLGGGLALVGRRRRTSHSH